MLPSSMQQDINQFTNTLEQSKQNYINTNTPTAPVLEQYQNQYNSNNPNVFNNFRNVNSSGNSMFGFAPTTGPNTLNSGFDHYSNDRVDRRNTAKTTQYEAEKAKIDSNVNNFAQFQAMAGPLMGLMQGQQGYMDYLNKPKQDLTAEQGFYGYQKGGPIKPDSNLENLFEILDPTGISSYDDVYREYKKSGLSPETAMEVIGALPFVGKIGKLTKAGIHLKKYKGLDNIVYKGLNSNRALANSTANSYFFTGKGSDMLQARDEYLNEKQKGGMINSTGYTPGYPSMNNPYNIIPSNQITMRNTPFPVMGIGNNGQRRMMMPGNNYNFPGASYVTEIPMKYQEGGEVESPEMVPLQAEVGEYIAFEDGTITPVKAKKRHKHMKDDEVTELLPEGAYIFSRDPKLTLYKNKKFKGVDLNDISLGYTPIEYSETEVSSAPKEIKFLDFMNTNKFTPADLASKLKSTYKVTDRENDAFATLAIEGNKASRSPYLEIIKGINELKKEKPDQYKCGGKVKKKRKMQDGGYAWNDPYVNMQHPMQQQLMLQGQVSPDAYSAGINVPQRSNLMEVYDPNKTSLMETFKPQRSNLMEVYDTPYRVDNSSYTNTGLASGKILQTKGDPYEYLQAEDGTWKTRKKGSGDWKTMNAAGVKAIESQIMSGIFDPGGYKPRTIKPAAKTKTAPVASNYFKDQYYNLMNMNAAYDNGYPLAPVEVTGQRMASRQVVNQQLNGRPSSGYNYQVTDGNMSGNGDPGPQMGVDIGMLGVGAMAGPVLGRVAGNLPAYNMSAYMGRLGPVANAAANVAEKVGEKVFKKMSPYIKKVYTTNGMPKNQSAMDYLIKNNYMQRGGYVNTYQQGGMISPIYNNPYNNAITGSVYRDPLENRDKALRTGGVYSNNLYSQSPNLKKKFFSFQNGGDIQHAQLGELIKAGAGIADIPFKIFDIGMSIADRNRQKKMYKQTLADIAANEELNRGYINSNTGIQGASLIGNYATQDPRYTNLDLTSSMQRTEAGYGNVDANINNQLQRSLDNSRGNISSFYRNAGSMGLNPQQAAAYAQQMNAQGIQNANNINVSYNQMQNQNTLGRMGALNNYDDTMAKDRQYGENMTRANINNLNSGLYSGISKMGSEHFAGLSGLANQSLAAKMGARNQQANFLTNNGLRISSAVNGLGNSVAQGMYNYGTYLNNRTTPQYTYNATGVQNPAFNFQNPEYMSSSYGPYIDPNNDALYGK